MYVKGENGNMIDVASNSKANAGLATGIIGTALGALNGGLNLMGSGYSTPMVTRNGQYIGSEADEINKLRMDKAILQSESSGDKKMVEVYTVLNRKDNEFRDRLDAVKEDLSNKIAAEREARILAQGEQAVFNAQVNTGIELLKSQQKSMAASLSEITEMVIPQSKICDTRACSCGM